MSNATHDDTSTRHIMNPNDHSSDTALEATAPSLLALAAAGSQPGWTVLDTARSSGFTGEIAFTTAPETRAYFDGGVAYYAVSDRDPSLREQLLEAGVVTASQLKRGVVRVGLVDHLGRLFDRDATVDRDAATVFVELQTDAVIADLASRPSGPFTVTAYRHHISGIHRWFVAPNVPMQIAPVSEVSQLDASITSILPGLPVSTSSDTSEDLRIEWDQAVIEPAPDQPSLHSLRSQPLVPIADHGAITSLDSHDERVDDAVFEFDAPVKADAYADFADSENETAPEWNAADASLLGEEVAEIVAFDDDFQIIWPDGTEVSVTDDVPVVRNGPIEAPAPIAPQPAFDPPAAVPNLLPAVVEHEEVEQPAPVADSGLAVDPLAPDSIPAIVAPLTRAPDVVPEPVLEQPSIEMPALAETDTLESDVEEADQPEEVVDAVRRALAAIEAAAYTAPKLASMSPVESVDAVTTSEPAVVSPMDVIDIAEPAPVDPAAAEPALAAPTAVSARRGFAPPTLDQSAEAMYARAAAPASAETPESIVLVDDADVEEDRAGALRRLIGNIRRK